ncbi:uncharacterized protein LOC131856114 [Cryptomeria japonica]|uniref:uncharacterized protein LOC131856114 n=1 Tax=Cryptomeria japonica TaxID=3369 RepID=UPI0027DA7E40|nr:uncharacterized protein LOC131856114 [Cryptomeria japonica]
MMSKTPIRRDSCWKHAELFPEQNRLKYQLAHIPPLDTVPCPQVLVEVQVQLETFEFQKEMKKRQREEMSGIGGNGESSSMPPFYPSLGIGFGNANVGGIAIVGAGASFSARLGPRIHKSRTDSFILPHTSVGSSLSFESWNKDIHDATRRAIGDFWYYCTIPFHAAKSPY